MTERNNILQELKDCGSSLPAATMVGLYQVPQAYFDDLPAVILSRIRTENATTAGEEMELLSPLLNGLSRTPPFNVPENYFSVSAEPDTSLLAEAGKKMPYAVPENYFEQLSSRIRPQASARVIPLTARKWFRYAAAAVVTGVVALSGLMIWRQQEPASTSQAFASKEVRKTLENTSVETLENFVQVTSAGISGKETATAVTAKNDELNSILREIPDSELNAFLDVTSDGSEEESLLN